TSASRAAASTATVSRARDAPARNAVEEDMPATVGQPTDGSAYGPQPLLSALSPRCVRCITLKRPELASTLPIRDDGAAPEGSIPPTVTSSARYPPDREGTRCHWSIARVVVRFVRVDGRDLGPLDAARTTSSGR